MSYSSPRENKATAARTGCQTTSAPHAHLTVSLLDRTGGLAAHDRCRAEAALLSRATPGKKARTPVQAINMAAKSIAALIIVGGLAYEACKRK